MVTLQKGCPGQYVLRGQIHRLNSRPARCRVHEDKCLFVAVRRVLKASSRWGGLIWPAWDNKTRMFYGNMRL